MKPLKLSIKANAEDHFIYRGYIYIALCDGSIVRLAINDVLERLVSVYPSYEGIISLAFRRNNFWNTDACKCFLSIPKVKDALIETWKEMSENSLFEINLSDLDPVTIIKNVKGKVLDMDVYADYLLIGTTEGFFSAHLNNPNDFEGNKRINLSKKFDAKIYKVSSSYGNSLLSLGRDGLTAADILTGKKVKDKLIRENISFSTGWTEAGGILNYSSGNEFQFIGNKVKRSKSSPEKYDIEEFDATYMDFNRLMAETEPLPSEIVIGFNNKDKQLYMMSDGSLFSSLVKVSSSMISKLKPRLSSTVKFDYQKIGKPISGLIVADQAVVEFDEEVVIITEKHQFSIESEGIVSMHSYPRSTHFRDIVSVTTDDCINLHAINVLDYSPEYLFAPPKQHQYKSKTSSVFI